MGTDNVDDKPGCLSSILRFLFPKSRSKTAAKSWDVKAYIKKPTALSRNEAAFYKALAEVVDDRYLIFPMVRLADIFEVRESSRSKRQADLNRISAKHFDYLLCNPSSFEPKYAIELDDRSHRRKDRIKRDKFVNELCTNTGLNLVRIPAAMKYSPKKIHDQILADRENQT